MYTHVCIKRMHMYILCIHTVHTYMHTYCFHVHTYIHTYIHTYGWQIGRRYKIMNPAKMRNTYGKLMYILMDTESYQIKSDLKFSFVKPILTVSSFLRKKNKVIVYACMYICMNVYVYMYVYICFLTSSLTHLTCVRLYVLYVWTRPMLTRPKFM